MSLLEDTARRIGSGDDDIIRYLKRNRIPVTRENYLEAAYPEGLPEEWGAELEAALPEQLRDT